VRRDFADRRVVRIAAFRRPLPTSADFVERPERRKDGSIWSRNANAKSFQLRVKEGGGTFKVNANRATLYQGISGLKAIRVDRTDLELVAGNAKGR
jgi:hypothetical protein